MRTMPDMSNGIVRGVRRCFVIGKAAVRVRGRRRALIGGHRGPQKVGHQDGHRYLQTADGL